LNVKGLNGLRGDWLTKKTRDVEESSQSRSEHHGEGGGKDDEPSDERNQEGQFEDGGGLKQPDKAI
jgi:hypothetical protein